jgi:hypothetical protein
MRNIEVSWVELAGPKAKDPDEIVLLGGTYGGRGWSMRPEAMAMAIDRGLYSFYAVVFEEVLPVVLVRNAVGKVCGIGTSKDVGPLKLLLTLARSGPEKSSADKSVTVTKTRNIGARAKKTVAVKSSK